MPVPASPDQRAPSTTTSKQNRRPRTKTRRVLADPLTHLVAAVLILVLVQAFVVKVYRVPSSSMEQTLQVGDRMLIGRLAYTTDEPEVGDIVVFNADDQWQAPSDDPAWKSLLKQVSETLSFGPGLGRSLVKRIIAGPGQTVECCSQTGALLLDDQPQDEPYLGSNPDFVPGVLDCTTTPQSNRCFPKFTVPEGRYVMLGDNRANSSDSVAFCRGQPDAVPSCLRTVARDDIVGEVWLVVWPPQRWGTPG